jgi:hypothetical protein
MNINININNNNNIISYDMFNSNGEETRACCLHPLSHLGFVIVVSSKLFSFTIAMWLEFKEGNTLCALKCCYQLLRLVGMISFHCDIFTAVNMKIMVFRGRMS